MYKDHDGEIILYDNIIWMNNLILLVNPAFKILVWFRIVMA